MEIMKTLKKHSKWVIGVINSLTILFLYGKGILFNNNFTQYWWLLAIGQGVVFYILLELLKDMKVTCENLNRVKTYCETIKQPEKTKEPGKYKLPEDLKLEGF